MQAMMRRDLYLLGRVAEVGVGLLEAMQRQVSPAPVEASPEASPEASSDDASEPAPLEAAARLFQGDIALAYARVSRAVRMTIALRTRMIEEITEAEQAQARNARLFAEAGVAAEELQRKERKGVVARVLSRVIQDEVYPDGPDGPEPPDKFTVVFGPGKREHERYESLIADASECLRDRERFGDVLNRPISEFIDLVCRDLGLAPDWRRLAEEAWAQEELRSGQVGKPLRNTLHPGAGRAPGFYESWATREADFDANDCAEDDWPPALTGLTPGARPAPA